jgi:hypothetical protein
MHHGVISSGQHDTPHPQQESSVAEQNRTEQNRKEQLKKLE